jgi:DNA relaxase NicK
LDFNKFHGILSRIDLYYDRRNQSTDKIHSQEFINSSFLEFQNHHSRKNLQVEKNQKGLVFKIGSRKSQKYYRIYTKDNFLRFEFEIKGNFIQDLLSLTILID